MAEGGRRWPLVLYALPPKLRRRVAIAMSGDILLDFRKARRQQEFSLRILGPLAYLAITALFTMFRMRGWIGPTRRKARRPALVK